MTIEMTIAMVINECRLVRCIKTMVQDLIWLKGILQYALGFGNPYNYWLSSTGY